MKYLLDSNLCISIMNQSAPTTVGIAVDRAINAGSDLFVPTITVHELWFGVAKSIKKQQNAARLIQFLAEPFKVIHFSAEDARISGEIRGELARRGTPIGPYDTLIAGQALARDLILVTANTREFVRVNGLKLEDWTL